MSWIKLISINITVLFIIFVLLEFTAGAARFLMGKDFRIPFQIVKKFEFATQPCIEMKTDVLLSHVHNQPEECEIRGGQAIGDYVLYGEKNDNLAQVLILGGSTSSGFYQHYSDGFTWPKYLSDLLDNEYSVINGAIGGYSSLQELYKVVRDLPRFKNLHSIISYNGINELPNYQGKNNIRMFQHPFLTGIQNRINESQYWIDQRIPINIFEKVSPNLNSFVRYILSGKRSINIQSESSNQRELFTFGIDAADRWEVNVRRIHSLAAQQGVNYSVFLQPTMGLIGLQSYAPPGSSDAKILNNLEEDYLNELQALYAELSSKCKLLNFCFDFSEVASPNGNLYSDSRHHNAQGNKIIANKIYEEFQRQNYHLK